MRSQKTTTRDALPLTAEGTTAMQQLPSCCQGRSQRERQPRPPVLSHQRGVGLLLLLLDAVLVVRHCWGTGLIRFTITTHYHPLPPITTHCH
jgi:hypothetical protein